MVAPLLPPQPAKGRRRGQDWEVLSGIMYRLKTGCRWRDIPKVEGYAAGSTCHCVTTGMTVGLGRGCGMSCGSRYWASWGLPGSWT